MGKLRILNHKGHTEVSWDLDAEKAITEAERLFNEHKAIGYAAVRTDTIPPRTLDRFDKTVEEVTMVLPVTVGGTVRMRQPIEDIRGWRAGSIVDHKIAALALGWRAVFHRGGTICSYYDDAGEPGVLSGIPPGETCVEAVPAYSIDHLWARRLAEQFDLEIGPGYTFSPLAVCITVLAIIGFDVNSQYFRDLSEWRVWSAKA